LTKHDPGSIDALFDDAVAPYILDAMNCFPKSSTLQLHGCRVLRRLYELSRRRALAGQHFVLLGKLVPEVWTWKGIEHVLSTMGLFTSDTSIQLECFNMLVPLADSLLTGGYSKQVFDMVEIVMRAHAPEADVLTHGIHVIARLGPTFLAHEHKGLTAIVDAMARHRSCVDLQRVGNKALFTLSSSEECLKQCRLDGAVSAVVNAMIAHNKDQQVLQMGVRSLERHCPRGLLKLSHICGDLVSVLPIVLWRTDPLNHNPPCFSVAALRADFDFEDGSLLDNFHQEVVANIDSGRPPSPQSLDSKFAGMDDRDNLATLEGFRRAGLRDEIDATDGSWAVPGPPPLYPPVRVAHNVLEKDVIALKKRGCDIEPQLVAGPRKGHVKLLCDSLLDGLPGSPSKRVPAAATPKAQPNQSAAPSVPAKKIVRFGPEDAELFACILGHFAWHSEKNANILVSSGGVSTLLKWLRCKEFSQSIGSADAHMVYPMQRACLAALACICRHGEDCASVLLAEGAHNDIIDFVTHNDIGMRRSALRCLARLIPHSKRRPTLSPTSMSWWDERKPSEGRRRPSDGNPTEAKPWGELVVPVVLEQLADDDEAIRTAAAACALETAVAGWAAVQNFEEQHLGEESLALFIGALVSALRRSVAGNAAAAALPVLLTMAQLSQDDEAIQNLRECDEKCGGLLPLLTTWPPRSAEATATGIDRAAAAAAAKALESLCETGVFRLSVRDLQMLLMCASSDHTMPSPTLREALEATLAVAVSREEDLGFLAQLLGTEVKAANGRCKLGNLDCLTGIAQKISELLEKAPGKHAGAASDTLVAALEHVQPLFDAEAKVQESDQLRQFLIDLRNTCGVQLQESGYVASTHSEDASPSADGTRLPPIARARTGSR
jgi:hypothetical protein